MEWSSEAPCLVLLLMPATIDSIDVREHPITYFLGVWQVSFWNFNATELELDMFVHRHSDAKIGDLHDTSPGEPCAVLSCRHEVDRLTTTVLVIESLHGLAVGLLTAFYEIVNFEQQLAFRCLIGKEQCEQAFVVRIFDIACSQQIHSQACPQPAWSWHKSIDLCFNTQQLSWSHLWMSHSRWQFCGKFVFSWRLASLSECVGQICFAASHLRRGQPLKCHHDTFLRRSGCRTLQVVNHGIFPADQHAPALGSHCTVILELPLVQHVWWYVVLKCCLGEVVTFLGRHDTGSVQFQQVVDFLESFPCPLPTAHHTPHHSCLWVWALPRKIVFRYQTQPFIPSIASKVVESCPVTASTLPCTTACVFESNPVSPESTVR